MYFNFSDFSIKKWKNTKSFLKESIKLTEKLKNSINKLFFPIYIIFGAFTIFFSMHYIWKDTALTRLERNIKENRLLICRTLICFWKELEKKTKRLSRLRFFMTVKVILNIFFFGRL